jgi:hypothetical protein
MAGVVWQQLPLVKLVPTDASEALYLAMVKDLDLVSHPASRPTRLLFASVESHTFSVSHVGRQKTLISSPEHETDLFFYILG